MRPNRSLSGLALALFLVVPAAFAIELQVEGPQDTLLGPPERTIPFGRRPSISLRERSGLTISAYTPISRARRAMSCVNCDP